MTRSGLPQDRIDTLTRAAEQGGQSNRGLLDDAFKGLSAKDALAIMQDMTQTNRADLQAHSTTAKLTVGFDTAPVGPDKATLLSTAGVEVDVQDATGFQRLLGSSTPRDTVELYQAPDFSLSGIASRYRAAGTEFAALFQESGQGLTKLATRIKDTLEG